MNNNLNLKKIFLISICTSITIIYVVSSFLVVDLETPINIIDDQESDVEITTPPQTAWFNNNENPILIDDQGAQNWAWARTQPWCSQGDGSWGDPYIIENVTIDQNGANDGIEIRNSNMSYFEIRNCTLFNGSIGAQAGIYLYNSSRGLLIDNNCTNSYYGINLEGSKNNTIQDNYAYNNSQVGIRLHNFISPTTRSQNNTLINNYCYNNTVGIYVWDANDTIIVANKCYNNSNAGTYLTTNSQNCKIYYNDFHHNTGSGLSLDTAHYSIIQGNNFTFNSDGIKTLYSSFMTIENNNCSNNSAMGINNEASDDNTIKDNIINDNQARGILIWEDGIGGYSDDCKIIDNDCLRNNYAGILVSKADRTILENNTISDNIQSGLYLAESYFTTIENNTCSNNGYSGISLDTCNYTTAINNTISNNIHSGLSSSVGVHHSVVSGNTLHYNGHHPTPSLNYDGLHIKGDNNTLTKNTCTSSAGKGIYIEGDRNNITENICIGDEATGQEGIRIKGDNNNITRNTFNYSYWGALIEGDNNNFSLNLVGWNNIGLQVLSGNTNDINFNEFIMNFNCWLDNGVGTINNTNTCVKRPSLPVDDPPTDDPPASIPGYELILLISIFSLLTILITKKRYTEILNK